MKLLLCITTYIYLFFACSVAAANLKQPSITLNDVKLISVGLNGAVVEVSLNVYNPNETDILVESIRYNLTVNNTQVKRGAIKQPTTLPAKKRLTLKVKTGLAYDQNLPAVLAILSSTKPATYKIKGDIKLNNEDKLWPFKHAGRWNLSDM